MASECRRLKESSRWMIHCWMSDSFSDAPTRATDAAVNGSMNRIPRRSALAT